MLKLFGEERGVLFGRGGGINSGSEGVVVGLKND
jgi:hypothetical protein